MSSEHYITTVEFVFANTSSRSKDIYSTCWPRNICIFCGYMTDHLRIWILHPSTFLWGFSDVDCLLVLLFIYFTINCKSEELNMSPMWCLPEATKFILMSSFVLSVLVALKFYDYITLPLLFFLLSLFSFILCAPLQAIMKSFVASGSDPSKPEKFLAYMVPAPDEVELVHMQILTILSFTRSRVVSTFWFKWYVNPS